MRLAVGAAILAHRLPTSSSLKKDDALFDSSPRHTNDVLADAASYHGGQNEGFRLSNSIMPVVGYTNAKFRKDGRLSNSYLAPGGDNAVACDPHGPADVGVLSCGAGRYCAESADSLLGGICMDSSTGERKLKFTNVTKLAYQYQVFCVYNADTCNCTLYDATAYTLNVQCASPDSCEERPSNCGEIVNHCFAANVSVQFSGPGLYSREYCYFNSLPYKQDVCYKGSTSGDVDTLTACEMTFAGILCNSCDVQYPYMQVCDPLGNCYTAPESAKCYYFDCTNTPGMHKGKSCYFEGSPIFEYMYTNGCTQCELCPGGSVANTNGTVLGPVFTVPGYDHQCHEIEFIIANGFYLTDDNCTLVQTGLAGFCCGEGPATLPPAFVPTVAPGAPTSADAPAATPSAAVPGRTGFSRLVVSVIAISVVTVTNFIL